MSSMFSVWLHPNVGFLRGPVLGTIVFVQLLGDENLFQLSSGTPQ